MNGVNRIKDLIVGDLLYVKMGGVLYGHPGVSIIFVPVC